MDRTHDDHVRWKQSEMEEKYYLKDSQIVRVLYVRSQFEISMLFERKPVLFILYPSNVFEFFEFWCILVMTWAR